MKLVHIKRYKGNQEQSIGLLTVFENDLVIFECMTMEPAWRNNQKNVSCIPLNTYKVKTHISPRYGDVYEVQNVVNRGDILFHQGNYKDNTEGCILVGDNIADINVDGLFDITNSKSTLKAFFDALDYEDFKLIIT